MKRILVIGIGTGNIDHLTVEAINALNQADAIFILDKGEATADLAQLRKDICARYIRDREPRLLLAPSPPRAAPTSSYKKSVDDWHAAKSDIFTALIGELKEGECGAFLVWGDPSLYDSTLRILERVVAEDLSIEYEVIPGISSLHALAARHRIPLNRIGQSVLITTGRKLAEEGFPQGPDTVVVLLDGGPGLEAMAGKELEIYWGAYLCGPDEVLISGPIGQVIDQIRAARKKGKSKKGWIMDTYMLRRLPGRG
jgi:precorrin-6A synthase